MFTALRRWVRAVFRSGRSCTRRKRAAVPNLTPLESRVLLSAVLLKDDFSNGPSTQWRNEVGNWNVSNGVYQAQAPSNNPLTYDSLPYILTDFVLDVDINDIQDGGIWLRSSGNNNGLLLVTGGQGGAGTGLYAQPFINGQNEIIFTFNHAFDGMIQPGVSDGHLHIAVTGSTYTVQLTVGAETRQAQISNYNAFPSGRVALYDNRAITQSFDNVQLSVPGGQVVRYVGKHDGGPDNDDHHIVVGTDAQDAFQLTVIPGGVHPQFTVWLNGNSMGSYPWWSTHIDFVDSRSDDNDSLLIQGLDAVAVADVINFYEGPGNRNYEYLTSNGATTEIGMSGKMDGIEWIAADGRQGDDSLSFTSNLSSSYFTSVTLDGGSGSDSIAYSAASAIIAGLGGGEGDDSLSWNTSGAGRGVSPIRVNGGGGSNSLYGSGSRPANIVCTDNNVGTDVLNIASTWALDFSQAALGVQVDLNVAQQFAVLGGRKLQLAATANLSSLLSVTGSRFDDQLRAAVAALNGIVFYGGMGDDSLIGGPGLDYLFGERGRDTLEGGGGNDYLAGGLDDDEYVFRDPTGFEQVVIAEDPNNTVNNTGDRLNFSACTIAASVNLSSDTVDLGTQGSRTLAVDDLGHAAAIESIIGTSGDDTFVTNAARNFLDGLDGNDTFVLGKAGPFVDPDNLNGQQGDDRYVLTPAQDFQYVQIQDSGAGDVLDFSQSPVGVTVDLTQSDQWVTNDLHLAGADSLRNVIGSNFDDTLVGNDGNNFLVGLDGRDTLTGNGGRDMLFGGVGADALDGGEDDDVLIGSPSVHDQSSVALLSLMAEWQDSNTPYATRVEHLINGGGRNGQTKLNPMTVIIDAGAANQLQGGNGTDWFLKTVNDTSDNIAGEIVTTLGNQIPTVNGTLANQAVNDNATVSPFATLTITDPDTQTMTASVRINNGIVRGDFTNTAGWTRTVLGNDIQYAHTFPSAANIGSVVQAAVRSFVFRPRSNAIKPNTTEATAFTLTVSDGIASPVSNNTTSVVTTSVNDAPSFGGLAANLPVNDNAAINPLGGLAVADVDMQEMLISVTILNGKFRGDFSPASVVNWPVRYTTGNDITYKRYFSPQANVGAAAQAAFRALVFLPRSNAIKPGTTEATDFQVTVSDGVAPALLGTGTRVTTTSVNDAPVIGGTVANQTINDNQTKAIFNTVTVTDPDTQDMLVRVTIANGIARGDFTAASTAGWTRAVSSGNIIYSRYFSQSTNIGDAAQTAIRGFVFQPRTNVTIGTQETTGFTVYVQDGSSSTATNGTTTVITTGVAPRPTLAATPMAASTAASLLEKDITTVVLPSIKRPISNPLARLLKKSW